MLLYGDLVLDGEQPSGAQELFGNPEQQQFQQHSDPGKYNMDFPWCPISLNSITSAFMQMLPW